jgi:hypothetical protein
MRLEWNSQNPQAPGMGPGVACSGVPDQIILDEARGIAIIRDLKTTDNAHPGLLRRKAVDMGWDIQEAAYREAAMTMWPWTAGRLEFQFVVVEREAPYAVTVVELAGSLRELGETKWNRAVSTWGRCLATNRWPDYSNIPVRIEALPWQISQEVEAEMDSAQA